MIPPLQNAIGRGEALGSAIWGLMRFFTILTNLLVAAVFGWIAMRGRGHISPLLLGAATLAIVLVGVVFNLVLGQMPQPTWWDRIGDSLHHHITPLAVPLWWLAFAQRGQLRWRAAWLWALYPLTYSVYILLRASQEPTGTRGRIPYFFMDWEKLGWSTAIINMAVIAAAFVIAGYGVVALDRWLARRAERG